MLKKQTKLKPAVSTASQLCPLYYKPAASGRISLILCLIFSDFFSGKNYSFSGQSGNGINDFAAADIILFAHY